MAFFIQVTSTLSITDLDKLLVQEMVIFSVYDELFEGCIYTPQKVIFKFNDMIRSNLFVFFIILFSSCNSTKNVEVELISFAEENAMTIRDRLFIKLETNDDCLIADINQFEVLKDRLFILDSFGSKKLYVFNKDGKYITNIGVRGNGPGEYISPSVFSIRNNVISILDKHQRAILFYDIETFEYIKTERIPYDICDFELSANNHFVFFGYQSINYPKKAYHYYIVDSVFDTKSKFVPVKFESGHIYPPFKNMYNLNGDIYGFIRFRNSIYKITNEEVSPRYELDVQQFEFPPLDYLKQEAETGINKNYMPTLESSNYISAFNISENDNLLGMNYFVNKKDYIGIYDKNKKNSYNYSISSFQEQFHVYGIEKMIGRSNEGIALLLRTYMIKNQTRGEIDCDQELKNLIKDSSSEDNPIIFIFNI